MSSTKSQERCRKNERKKRKRYKFNGKKIRSPTSEKRREKRLWKKYFLALLNFKIGLIPCLNKIFKWSISGKIVAKRISKE
jgi:hypothetical protein